MSVSELPEIGLVCIILVVVALTSLKVTYDIYNNVESNQQLQDKNSSIEYSTSIGKDFDNTDITEAVTSVIMSCDSDKLSTITVRVIKDTDVLLTSKVNKADLLNMSEQVTNIIGTALDMGLQIDEFFAHLKFNIVYMDIYVK